MMTLKPFIQKHYLFCLYFSVQNLMRLILGVQTSLTVPGIVLAICVGAIFDIFVWLAVTAVFRLIPKRKPFPLVLRLAGVFAGSVGILFVAMAEWNFWIQSNVHRGI